MSLKRYEIDIGTYMPFSRVSFWMSLSDLEWLSKIFNDTKHRLISLWQLNFLLDLGKWQAPHFHRLHQATISSTCITTTVLIYLVLWLLPKQLIITIQLFFVLCLYLCLYLLYRVWCCLLLLNVLSQNPLQCQLKSLQWHNSSCSSVGCWTCHRCHTKGHQAGHSLTTIMHRISSELKDMLFYNALQNINPLLCTPKFAGYPKCSNLKD